MFHTVVIFVARILGKILTMQSQWSFSQPFLIEYLLVLAKNGVKGWRNVLWLIDI